MGQFDLGPCCMARSLTSKVYQQTTQRAIFLDFGGERVSFHFNLTVAL